MNKGRIASGSLFVFRYLKQDTSSFAFVVSKKIAKTAVKRNQLRRIGYNIIRKYELKNISGIFFYKKEALKASNLEIKNDIDFLLGKTNII